MLALALAAGVASSAVARAAESEPQRVSIRVPSQADPLLDEALVRVRGELGAMGLDAVVEPSGSASEAPRAGRAAGSGGTLIVERDGAWIRIRAFGPASAVPVLQELDTRRPDVSAEVVAVRAVEALRAVMSGLPERRARAAEPTKAPKPAPRPTPPLASQGPAAETSLAPANESALTLWAAPNVLYDPGPGSSALGAELGAFWGHSSLFAGALLGTTLLSTSLQDVAGRVDLRRSTALARLGARFYLASSLELWLMLGGGLARYDIEGDAVPGFVGVSNRHHSALLATGAGATGWLSRHFGAYLRLDATLATDPPAILSVKREIALLEQPTLSVALGIILRAPRLLTP